VPNVTALSLALVLSLSAASAVAPPTPPPRAPPRVYAGIYLSDVSGFDLKEGRFHADFDVWLKWSGGAEPPVLRFVNGEIDAREEQSRESDGDWHSVRWRVQGTFRGTFPLHAFPFDRQQLRIELALPEDAGRLSPDLGSSGMAKQFSITGWEYSPFFRAEVGQQALASDLGSIAGEGRARVLDSVGFVLELRRPSTSNILKFMLPLSIILAMAFLVFAVPFLAVDVRSAMGVTALLSVVAFHFAMSGSLPDVPYLVAADRLFLASYVLVLLSVVETVVVYRLGETRRALIRRVDRASACALSLVALGVGVSVAIIPARMDARSVIAPPPLAPPPAIEAEKSSARDELVIGVLNLPSVGSGGLSTLLRRGLTQPRGDGELVPHLAETIPSMTDESVRLLPDGGMLVRWRLKPGLRWSDGTAINATDLLYSLKLVADPDRLEVTGVDDLTIEIRYRRRLAGALTDFPLYPSEGEVSGADAGDGGERRRRGQNEAGDGPYRVVSFTPERELLLERNPHWPGRPARVARVRVKVLPPEKMVEGLKSGEVHLLPGLPHSLAVAAESEAKAVTRSALDDAMLYLQPDLAHPRLSELKVRQAILRALDRNEIAHQFAEGSGKVAHTFRPEDAPDFAASVPRVKPSLVEAKRLLSEGGGLSAVKLLCSDLPEASGYSRACGAVAKSLEELGVAVERVKLDAARQGGGPNRREHGGLLLQQSRRDSRRPARFFNLPSSNGVLDTTTERPHFPPDVLELNQRLEASLFPERRRLLLIRMQERFVELLPLIPIAFGEQLSAVHPSLQGFEPGASGSLYWNIEEWRF
jgi:peptide/nickel transport system substrate-binding protein